MRRAGAVMTGVVMVVTSMVAVARAGAPAAQDAAQIERGREVYVEERCRICHSIGDDGNSRGPLDGVGSRLSAEDLELWMIDPDTIAERTNSTRRPAMPAYPELSEDDLAAIVAYMLSLTDE